MMMKNYTNFKEAGTQHIEHYAVLFMSCDQGVDWYEAVTTFANDTYKIQYDSNGVINSVTQDASMFTPLGYSVLELPELPATVDVLLSGSVWVVRDGKVVPKVFTPAELMSKNRDRKERLLSQATEQMSPLQDAVELNIATDEEAERLLVWRKYRVVLSRIDVAQTDGIEWPQPPVAV